MNAFQNCQNTSDLIPLYLPLQLYLKPIARLNISIQLPKLKKLGKSISHWEIMDKLRELIRPDEFTVLKVTKTTVEFVRFEGEVEIKSKVKNVVSKIENKMIRLKDFSDLFRVRVVEWKSDFPNRQMWDDFFQNCKDMNEMKPGQRPDTIYFWNLPTNWFISSKYPTTEENIPSEKILYRIFEKFGKLRCIDIPICDPYRKKMKSHISGFKNNTDANEYFECYVQFKDYIGFSKAMDTFRDMKLVRKSDDNVLETDIKVEFDKSKHLSDGSIKRREIVRDRLIKKAKEKEAKEQAEFEENKRKEHIERQREMDLKQQKQLRRKLREERRKAKILEKLEVTGTDEINEKIAKEEKKLLRVQRKLEAIRLVEELYKRIKDSSTDKVRHCDAENDELRRYKNASELEVLTQREKLHHAIKGRAMLKNLLSEGKKRKNTSASDSSLSLDEVEPQKEKAVIEKYPELVYNPPWFGYRYHLPPGAIIPEYSDFSAVGANFPRDGIQFQRFPGMMGASRGMFNRRGNPRRWFRGNNRGMRRQYPPELEEEYRKYFSKFLDERNMHRDNKKRSYSSSHYDSKRSRSRSNSRRRSYSRSYSRSRSRSPNRNKKSKQRSRSSRSRSGTPRSRSRTPRSRSRTPRSRSRTPRSRSRTPRSRSTRKPRSRSKSRSKSNRSRSHSRASLSDKDHSGSNRQSESGRDTPKKSKSKKKSREKSSTRKSRDKSVDSSTFMTPKQLSENPD